MGSLEVVRLGDNPGRQATGGRRFTAMTHPLRGLFLLGFGVLAMALLLSRLPRALIDSFWAEDGAVFYAQAYNIGSLHALFIPSTGYLQTFPRLEAAVAIHLPLSLGPSLALFVALVFDVLPGAFFLSDRFRLVVPSLGVRLALAIASVILPDTYEVNGNLANVQWHLALLGFLLLIALPPRTLLGHLGDLLLLLVGGLSGPFCLLLTPIAGWQWLRHRQRWLLPRLAVLATCSLAQGMVLLLHYQERAVGALQPSAEWLVKTLDRPLLTPLIGFHNYWPLVRSHAWQHLWLPTVVLMVCLLVAGYTLWRGPSSLRWLHFLGWTLLAAALIGASVSPTKPGGYWADLAGLSGEGWMRYFYLASLAWVASLIWLATSAPRRTLRVLGMAALVCGLLVAVPADWRYPRMAPVNFQASVQRFEAAPAGTDVTLTIQPFAAWTMTLHKRG